MTNTNEAVESRNKKRRKKRSRFSEIWRRFRKNGIGVAGLVIILILIFTAIFADVIAPPIYDEGLQMYFPAYMHQNLRATNTFPADGFGIMGTDHLGRCIFSRVVHGARTSLLIGFVVVGISMVIGVTLGTISGYYGRFADGFIMRVVDIIMAIPNFLLAISIVAALGPGLINVMIAVGIGSIPGFARQVRSSVISIREQEFIEAAKSIGASNLRIMFRHIITNSTAPIIVRATMGMAVAILSAAALSFLGIGIEPPTPEWGAMLSQGRAFVLAGHWPSTVFPGLAIALVVFGLNMLGDGLRDALDPRLKR